ncbi:hypothetical protein DPEC_G00103510 [Dallia pectoralis]|uniref:Uncharacterized protein n=1 Tax=Dallia pectoralis TaxID=75939 RepID=A0ACC2GXT2_DALPE|nr:hypothetical protein DPEC_G00103510 [Dallia pectoralis]
MTTSKLIIHSRYLLVCLVVSAVDVTCSYPSRARSTKTVQEETIYLETEEPRYWRPLFYPFTSSQILIPRKLVPNHIQRGQPQGDLILRHGAKSGTNTLLANPSEGLHDEAELGPVNSGHHGVVQSVRGNYVPKEVHQPQRQTFFRMSSWNPDESNSQTTLGNGVPHEGFPGNSVSSHDAFNSVPSEARAPQRQNELNTVDPQESDQLYIQELNSLRAVEPFPKTSQPITASPMSFQGRRFSSRPKPIKTGHYHNTNPFSDLGSPIVPVNLGNPGHPHAVKTPSIQSGNVAPSSMQHAGKRRGSPVVDHTHIHVQWSENPLSKGDGEGEKSINTRVVTFPAQSKKNSSVGESGTSTHVKGDYSSVLYPRSFKSGKGQRAAEHQSATLKESEPARRITRPFHRRANLAHIGRHPGKDSYNDIDGPQARSSFSTFLPGSRFGVFWNALTKAMQNPRKKALSNHVPDQSLTTKSRPVSWGNNRVLRNSSSAQSGGPTGNYKLGKSTGINTVFGFKGFQDPAPKILASIENEDQPVHLVSNSINTVQRQHIGWRKSFGKSKGMNLGSVSRYPHVLKKYVFAPITTEVPITDPPVPAPFTSDPREEQSLSVEDNLVPSDTKAAHGESIHSLDVVKSDTDSVYVDHSSDSAAPRQHVISTKHAIPVPNTSKPFHLKERFKKFEFGSDNDSKGFRSKQNKSLDTKLPEKSGPSDRQVESAPTELQSTSITGTANQSLEGCSGGPKSDTSCKTGDAKSTAQYSEIEKNLNRPLRYKSGKLPKSPGSNADLGFNILTNKVGRPLDKVTAKKVVPVIEDHYKSGSDEDSGEHPPRVAPISSNSVHPGHVSARPHPSPTKPTHSRHPTSSVAKGKMFKGKLVRGQNVLPPSVVLSSPNNTASPSLLRLGERRPMMFKPIQFADILGSASFSGSQQREYTASAFTEVPSHSGGAPDIWLGSPQDGGNPRAVPRQPVPSSTDTGQSGEGNVSSAEEDVQSMEGDFSSVKGMMGGPEPHQNIHHFARPQLPLRLQRRAVGGGARARGML